MVSVIIPSYGRQCSMVMRAVESVKKQTYTDWELYLVDDNKDDNPYSKEIESAIRKENSEKIHYLRMEKNSGACAARNKGIEVSSGEFVAFLDDDDEWVPTKLEKQMKDAAKMLEFEVAAALRDQVLKQTEDFRERGLLQRIHLLFLRCIFHRLHCFLHSDPLSHRCHFRIPLQPY